MIFKDIVNLMIKKPYLLEMGKGKLSKMFKCTPDEVVKAKRDAREFTRKIPKVLLFDVETTPMICYTWGRYNQNIGLKQTIQESYMLCWSASWLHENEIFGDCVTSNEAISGDDSRIVSSLWDAVNSADVVIAYNGIDFDFKIINSRFFLNGLNPPKTFKVIDPCKEARKLFKFSSNKLDALATFLNIPCKMETDFNLWKDCMRGDEDSLLYMFEYNKKDVNILKEVYIKMLPYITNHPNINILTDETDACPQCGFKKIEKLHNQFCYTKTNKYQLYRCCNCGKVFRSRTAIKQEKLKFV